VELLRDGDAAEEYAEARQANDFDVAAVIAGESSGLVHDITTVGAVVDRIVSGAEALLGLRAPRVVHAPRPLRRA
jgi:nitronate monooxygenase